MPENTPKWKTLLDEFESAVQDHAWKGGGHPAEIDQLEAEYDRSKKALVDYLKGGGID